MAAPRSSSFAVRAATRGRSLVVVLALSMVGCAAFASLFGPSEAEREAERQAQEQAARQAEAERQARQAAADQEFVAQLETRRLAAQAEGADLQAVLDYAEQVCVAYESGAVQRGLVTPELGAEAEALLAEHYTIESTVEGAGGAEPLIAVTTVQGRLLAALARFDEATVPWLEALRMGGPLEIFDALASLPGSPTTDAAMLDACALVRPSLTGEAVVGLVELCLARAQGDASRLAWKGAKSDLAAYEAELVRREQEAARLAAEAEAQAAAEAAAAAKRAQQAVAAVFAAGRCRFGDCLKEGWDLDTDEGTIRTRCRFGDCFAEGWDTEFPDGSRATTRCRFGDCTKEGWDTELPEGRATTRCRFSDCFTEGWETELPEGGRATTRCRFSKCFEEGWETDLPGGGSVRCTCRFSNCLEEGTQCD